MRSGEAGVPVMAASAARTDGWSAVNASSRARTARRAGSSSGFSRQKYQVAITAAPA